MEYFCIAVILVIGLTDPYLCYTNYGPDLTYPIMFTVFVHGTLFTRVQSQVGGYIVIQISTIMAVLCQALIKSYLQSRSN